MLGAQVTFFSNDNNYAIEIGYLLHYPKVMTYEN